MDHRPLPVIFFLLILVLGTGCTSPVPTAWNASLTQTSSGTPTGGGSSNALVTPEPSITATPGDDLISFVNDAVVYSQRVGRAAALEEFADPNGSFTRGDRCIVAFDYNGTNLAHPFHPEYAGQDMLSQTDAAGVRMIGDMRDAARNGSGFVAWQHENPATGITEPGLSYVKRVDDTWWLGSGVVGYEVGIPQQSPDVVRQVLFARVSHAVGFAREVGREAANEAFNNISGPFAANGSYIFGFDMNGTTLARGFQERVGGNAGDLTDMNGVSIGQRKIRLAQQGGGYFYYVYTDPVTGKPGFKVSYVEPVDPGWGVGAGTYLPGVPTVFTQERRDRIVQCVGEAVSYVRTNGREAAVREFNDPNGSFSDPEMFVFAFDRNGTLLANPFLPGIVGMNRLQDRDPYGEYPVPYIIDNAVGGGGFMYYFFADPSSDYRIRLKLAYSQMAGDDLVVGAGIFS
ncbi:MAG: cache domain-containing protein [Methanoregulaceae archaeon]|nr:cache domain-containing protein [Methanoregulaceae archaeon]